MVYFMLGVVIFFSSLQLFLTIFQAIVIAKREENGPFFTLGFFVLYVVNIAMIVMAVQQMVGYAAPLSIDLILKGTP